MARTPVWKSIAGTLTDDIAQGRYDTGDKLPAEAQLAARFGVNRHTVRRALAEMAAGGLVHARRGAGVFVAARPTDYPIGKRVRFHQNISKGGQTPAKQILTTETRAASAGEAAALALPPGDPVHVYDGLSLADGQPIALFQSIFPAERFPEMLTALEETQSVTAALQRCGIEDYTRLETRITARQATATQALHLRVPEGAPILRTTGINVDAKGIPIEYGRTWFAGDRVTLTVGGDS
ncbi:MULTISPECIES: phosphonate metabolism transcriptional regulator PhnF [Rhodobacterales]|jgi:GntR family phosphonate transport system transcriptional regulator|uniref:phosphonate metabolism transcriptional regulator PhnF n=1 Tax=Rhodobacterales TaxID=204455 RepID=UPI00237F8A36|nr:phosphonate metabolism transcriptional regulator PhnF [Phaeobacter gallaeciensis]MDE4141144.1 phosphonate metabolism transcriptional regulator PhnF [Phaeobacter gallaeciensis]MDE4149589.1 phosphonate metabolism transcriptional regulator PhnF [Phaeobacter gallaeciensis]MDE4153961.1 phosphonate metabolism transcriptional regulator PhnF [Phaeobacter gallaeciensis]MDE4229353.1 phosphonate metabolism transcriptional regulator PhnF [Phaeobacter gallaeciensis]MDE4258279.1 phosphonate metabolism tr